MQENNNRFESISSTIQFIIPESKPDGVHLTLGQKYKFADVDIISVTLPPAFTRLIQTALSMFIRNRGTMLYQDHQYRYTTENQSGSIQLYHTVSEGVAYFCMMIGLEQETPTREFLIVLDTIRCRKLNKMIGQHIYDNEFMNGTQCQIDWSESQKYGNALWYGELFIDNYYDDEPSTLIIHHPKEKDLAHATFEIHQRVNGEDLIGILKPEQTEFLVTTMHRVARRVPHFLGVPTDTRDFKLNYDEKEDLFTLQVRNESDTHLVKFVCSSATMQEIILRVKY